MMTKPPYTALLYDQASHAWQAFRQPCRVVTTERADAVQASLQEVERAVNDEGLHAVGFVSYEAAPAFDPALTVHADGDFPLLWFGLFEESETIPLPEANTAAQLDWQSGLSAHDFSMALASIKKAIARGETYQVNFTFPFTTNFPHDPWPFFLGLVRNQHARHAAWLDTGRYAICSASPELFFELDGQRLWSRPMKGTAPRGMTTEDDRASPEALRFSETDRAENVMILDMIRNDLGRLPGGPVQTSDPFSIEKYPTLWQMTSTAETATDASISEIFRALFPCASITGAPKVQTMKLIRTLERQPRRIYTGAIGTISPKRKARFSVAIRTALIDRERQSAEYGVGAGITWNSDPAAEYRECLLKARILSQPQPQFQLLETLLWEPAEGYALRGEHLQRLAASAEYFDYPLQQDEVAAQLEKLAATLPPCPHKVRLLVAQNGQIETEATPLALPAAPSPLRVALAEAPIDSGNPFLYHKTTRREIYEHARQEHPDVDEVLLWNERGELTEACNCNLVIEKNGKLLTPPLSSGLLAGTLRARLLQEGKIKEQVLCKDALDSCDKLWLINSVRGWREARLEKDV